MKKVEGAPRCLSACGDHLMFGTALLGHLTILAGIAGCGSPDTCLIQLVLEVLRCLLSC